MPRRSDVVRRAALTRQAGSESRSTGAHAASCYRGVPMARGTVVPLTTQKIRDSSRGPSHSSASSQIGWSSAFRPSDNWPGHLYGSALLAQPGWGLINGQHVRNFPRNQHQICTTRRASRRSRLRRRSGVSRTTSGARTSATTSKTCRWRSAGICSTGGERTTTRRAPTTRNGRTPSASLISKWR